MRGPDCRFDLDGAVKNGDIVAKLVIHNDSSSSRKIKVRMFANAKYYTGIAGEEIDDFEKETTVPGKKCKLIIHHVDIIFSGDGWIDIGRLCAHLARNTKHFLAVLYFIVFPCAGVLSKWKMYDCERQGATQIKHRCEN